jgi:hypothetical protein
MKKRQVLGSEDTSTALWEQSHQEIGQGEEGFFFKI